MPDRRESRREATSLLVHVLTTRGRMPCTMVDRSERGAQLKVLNPFDLPETFTLVIKESGEIRDVHVTWRQHNSIGVMFA
ncbi:PilZ domain-containing protein [Methylobacterium sp. A49B]